MRALKALGVVAQILATLVFGGVLYLVSPLLFMLWLVPLGATLFFLLIVFAVRVGLRSAREGDLS